MAGDEDDQEIALQVLLNNKDADFFSKRAIPRFDIDWETIARELERDDPSALKQLWDDEICHRMRTLPDVWSDYDSRRLLEGARRFASLAEVDMRAIRDTYDRTPAAGRGGTWRV